MIAPERIWATPFDYQSEGGTYCDAENRPLAPNKDAWCYVRPDAPELLAMVDALWAMRDMAKIGKPMVATEIMAAADQAAAAITAWEKLTK